MGWMERLRDDAKSEPRIVDTISEMEQDVNRLNKVAARFSKIGSKPDLHEESLTDVLSGVIQYIGKRIPKSGRTVDLVIETPGTFTAPINRELFEWVIENLMKNALDAMEGAAGKISFCDKRIGAMDDSGRERHRQGNRSQTSQRDLPAGLQHKEAGMGARVDALQADHR